MKRLVLSATATLALASGSLAHADPPTPGRSDPAAAQALFYESRSLMRDGKYAIACPKLEESLRLDYGIGTEFNLADCNEKLGKLATAWSGFVNVAAASKAQNQPQREKVARDRAKALEPRLPRLVIEVIAPGTPNLEVKRDGVVIGAASWGTTMPVDPGPHRITASAPDKQPWEGAVSAGEGKTARLTVPILATTAVVAAPAIVAPRRIEPPQPTELPAPFPEPVVERGGTQRAVGWVVSVAGLAGLGVSAGFGIDSLQKRERSKDHCQGNLCDSTGLSLRDKAMDSGDVATIAGVAGGAALLGGIILVLSAPRGPSRNEAPPTSFRAVPLVAANGGGLSLQGVLP